MNRRAASGFSLLELMLALLLGSLLSAAVLHAYTASWRTLQWHVELLRMEENGRHALRLLGRELRMAGFYARSVQQPPAPPPGAPACGASAGWPLQLQHPVALANDVRAAAPLLVDGSRLNCLPEADLQDGSDVLAIKRSAARPALTPVPGVDQALPLRTGYWYLEYTDPSSSLGWHHAAAGAPAVPPTGAQWWELQVNVFFVRNYSAVRGDGVPALCSERLQPSGMRTECLVEGVEQLHVEFGLDEDGDGAIDSYHAAPTALQLSRALEARVYLLLRSVSRLPQVPEQRSYQLGSRSVVTLNDGYLRRVVAATVPVFARVRAA